MSDQAQWGTLTIKVPDFLENAKDAVNSVAEFLVNILDIVMAALDLVKAFLSAYIDPILSLIQKIIDELNSLIRDIRQMGIYITGDWKLFKYPFDDLRGGYSAFERRMLVRMTDRTDPTRPDVSGNMKVLGSFFYLSVDLSEMQRLVAFIMRLIAFFKQDWSNTSLPTCTITEVRYGTGTVDILHPMSLGDAFQLDSTPPQMAQVRWKIRTDVGQQNPFNPFPPTMFGPDGFLVTVSTFPDGIKVCYDKPQTDTDTQPSNSDPSVKIQPRSYGLVRKQDGRPLVLHGGTQLLTVPSSMGWNEATTDIGTSPGKVRVYGQGPAAMNAPIPLDEMEDFFQRSFWVDTTSTVFQSFTGEYSINFGLKDMPREGAVVIGSGNQVSIEPVTGPDGDRRAGTVHVRVAACNKAALEKTVWDLSNPMASKLGPMPGILVAPTAEGVNITDIGEFSSPQRVTFPNAYTAQYLQSVQAALVVLFLSRPDLIPVDQLKQVLSPDQIAQMTSSPPSLLVAGTVQSVCGLESLKQLLRVLFDGALGPQWQYKQRGGQPPSFRLALWRRIMKFTQDLYARTGSMPDVERFVATNTTYLRNVTWGDILRPAYPDLADQVADAFLQTKLLDSLNASGESGNDGSVVGNLQGSGVAVNPWCIGISDVVVDDLFYDPEAILGRTEAGMYEAKTVDPGITLQRMVLAVDAQAYIAELPSGLRERYKKYIQEDGSILVPDEDFNALEEQVTTGKTEGSADCSPVVYNENGANSTMVFCRGLLVNHEGPTGVGQLITETQIALGLAGSLWKRTDDGAWIAIRFFDIFPGVDDFLETLRNWMEAIKKMVQSIVDTIIKYIEWLEARIMDLQQLIRRINALIQSLLGFMFQIPACSYMACVSDGTGGLLSDFMGARNKPGDSPLAYGAGIALVVPFCPSFLYDLFSAFFAPEPGQEPSGVLAAPAPPDMIPLNGLAPPAGESQDDPPDIL
jgi:hypothetical protein